MLLFEVKTTTFLVNICASFSGLRLRNRYCSIFVSCKSWHYSGHRVSFVTARVRSTREGNVLTSVCPSIHPSVCPRGGVPISHNALQHFPECNEAAGGTRVRYPPLGGVPGPPPGGYLGQVPPPGGVPGSGTPPGVDRTTEG